MILPRTDGLIAVDKAFEIIEDEHLQTVTVQVQLRNEINQLKQLYADLQIIFSDIHKRLEDLERK